jgi:hypothetical protein
MACHYSEYGGNEFFQNVDNYMHRTYDITAQKIGIGIFSSLLNRQHHIYVNYIQRLSGHCVLVCHKMYLFNMLSRLFSEHLIDMHQKIPVVMTLKQTKILC